MLQAFKIRLYPNKEQTKKLLCFMGSCRFVYNKGLQYRIEQWETEKKTINYNALSEHLTHTLKVEFKWLYETPAQVLQQTLKDLDTAYSNFFRTKKGYPKFKRKHDTQGIRFTNQSIPKNPFNSVIDRLSVSKIANIKFRCSDEYKDIISNNDIKSITITKTATNKFYASILVDVNKVVVEPTNDSVGIDLGIKSLMVFSDGTNIENPKWLKKNEKKLKKLQRILSKKTKGSNNRKKCALKFAKLHEKIKNQRVDFLHKTSTKIVNDNQVIIIEDLNVKGMVKNHKLAKAIHEIGLGEFRRLLEYKAAWYKRDIVIIDRFFPSTQKCSNCGNVKNGKDKLTLGNRIYKCSCGHVMDRDLNAAINIKKEGLRIYNS
jgi:putative transposase